MPSFDNNSKVALPTSKNTSPAILQRGRRGLPSKHWHHSFRPEGIGPLPATAFRGVMQEVAGNLRLSGTDPRPPLRRRPGTPEPISSIQFRSEATVVEGGAQIRAAARGPQVKTSRRSLLMIDTLDHVESTIGPNCVFAFPQVTYRIEKFQLGV